jgi:hypothetical protein
MPEILQYSSLFAERLQLQAEARYRGKITGLERQIND